MINTKKGFTLIELLVVVSIIGLLSSVALASLTVARARAADSNIKSNLNQIRNQGEILFGNDGDINTDYTSMFVPDGIADRAFDASMLLSGGNGDASSGVAGESIWYVWVNLKTDPTKSWCVDAKGSSREIVSPPGNAISLNGCDGL